MVVETESAPAVENRRGVLGFLLERYPGEHLSNGGRAHPRNEFERYVVQYDVPIREHHELPLREGDERPGDVMIQHDMSTCILCTRCVRACEDIQEVGVLDVGMRGEHAQIIVGGDGDPDHAGCTWCGECVRVCPTGAIFEFIPKQRFGSEAVRHPDKVVRSVCPYCGVGCQIDIHVKDDAIMRVTSPSIEEYTPNQGSTCVKGRFGYDFPQHRDRLMVPLIRKGWAHDGQRWVWTGEWPRHREGPWRTIEEMGERDKPRPPRRSVGQAAADRRRRCSTTYDVRDRVATPAGLVQRLPRGHLGGGDEPHRPGAAPDPRHQRAPGARRALVGQVQQRGQLRLHADGAGGVPHQQRGPLHPALPLDLGGRDEPRAQHLGRVGLDARDRGGVRRHLHLGRQHHRDPPGLRRPDQAGREPRAPS